MRDESSGVTKRESEVLALLATHCTYAEIGDKLFVSTNTVKTHTRHIYDKLGVRTRSNAVQRAIELRLIAAPVHSYYVSPPSGR